MKYENPELRERLAAEYILGTMPRLPRQRFERLIAADPTLARLVADWAQRFAPIDEATPEAEPPARVWRAIERRVFIGEATASHRQSWFGSIALWRGFALAAATATAALILYITVSLTPPTPIVVAVLSDSSGDPGWVALGRPGRAEISVAAIRPLAEDAAHSFELWGIAGATPRPLGLLHPLYGDPARGRLCHASGRIFSRRLGRRADLRRASGANPTDGTR